MIEAGCLGCRFGQFARTPTGQPRKNTPGRCAFEPTFTVPEAIKIQWQRNGIWPGDGQNCPAREAKPE